jgi:Amidases related to nicotinamidase
MALVGLGGPKETALIISECQNGMTNPAHSTNDLLSGQVAKRGTIANIEALASRLRPLGVQVVHSIVVPFPDWRGWVVNSPLTGSIRKRDLVEGHVSTEIHPRITVDPRDIVVKRRRGLTSFHGTELEHILRGMGIRSIIMTGVSLNVAIPGSVIEAVNRGFSVVIPEDCVSGATDESHDFALTKMLPVLATVTTSRRLVEELMGRE